MNRSVLESEVMAFADAFDMAYIFKHDLQPMEGSCISLTMMTDRLSWFDVLTKASSITEKRLMMDLQTVQNSNKNMEI